MVGRGEEALTFVNCVWASTGLQSGTLPNEMGKRELPEQVRFQAGAWERGRMRKTERGRLKGSGSFPSKCVPKQELGNEGAALRMTEIFAEGGFSFPRRFYR